MAEFSIPPGLLKALCDRKCLLFVGAGASQGEGIEGAGNLASHLAHEILTYVKDPDKVQAVKEHANDLAKTSELYKDCLGHSNVRAVLAARIREQEEKASAVFHNALVNLPTINYIVTTNWDTLIENHLPAGDVYTVRRDSDIYNSSPLKTNVYKMHGCITDPQSMLLTLNDFAAFKSTRTAIRDELRSLLRKHTIVCVGYAMEDANFRELMLETIGRQQTADHYFVAPGAHIIQAAQWKELHFVQINATAQDFVQELVARFDESQYQSTSAHVSQPSGDAGGHNPFSLYSTEALSVTEPQRLVRYFIEPVEAASVLDSHNVVVEGHRGSGKSMLFKYYSLTNDAVRDQSINFYGFYVKLESGFFESISPFADETPQEWAKRFQHYFNLVVGAGILVELKTAIASKILHPESELLKQACLAVHTGLLRLPGESISLDALLGRIYEELDSLHNEPRQSHFRTSPRFLTALQTELGKGIPQLGTKWWALFLDEWDNLSIEQQRAVVMRLHDRNPTLWYKVATKSLGFVSSDFAGRSIERPDDYVYICLDHHIFDQRKKPRYFEFLRQVSGRRLEFAQNTIVKIDDLLPSGDINVSHYVYSGFECFAMLSSGLVREFLELCKDAAYSAFPELMTRKIDLQPIPPKWQNHVARVKAAIHFNNYRGCQYSEEVSKLMFTFGSVFKAIELATRDQDEDRKPLSFDITDYYDLDTHSNEVLSQAVKNRLLQIPESPLQPRNPSEGAKQKYVFHRLICPYYKLSVFESHSVPVRAKILSMIWTDPHGAMSELTKTFKSKGIQKHLPKDKRHPDLWEED